MEVVAVSYFGKFNTLAVVCTIVVPGIVQARCMPGAFRRDIPGTDLGDDVPGAHPGHIKK